MQATRNPLTPFNNFRVFNLLLDWLWSTKKCFWKISKVQCVGGELGRPLYVSKIRRYPHPRVTDAKRTCQSNRSSCHQCYSINQYLGGVPRFDNGPNRGRLPFCFLPFWGRGPDLPGTEISKIEIANSGPYSVAKKDRSVSCPSPCMHLD